MASDLAVALGLALTGESLALSAVETLATDLAELGFSAEKLQKLRSQCQSEGTAWPYPVPLELRRSVGFAAFDAALLDIRQQLGVTGLVAQQPVKRSLTADDLRLLAEKPPHW